MKNKKTFIAKIAVLIVICAALAALLYTASDTFRAVPYNPLEPTPKKLAMLTKWIPQDADFIAISDTHRLAMIPSLKNFLEEGLFKGSNTAIKTIHSLLGPQTTIGMLAMSGVLGDSGMPVSFSVVVQGDFREIDFVDAIKKEMEKENAALTSQTIGGISLYSQEGDDALFAFAVPDNKHLIVGSKTLMEQTLAQTSSKKNLPFLNGDLPFFGFLNFSDRIKKLLPPQFASLNIAHFWADEEKWLHISIECADITQAQNLKMFLSGMKALYALQNELDKTFSAAIGSIEIGGEKNAASITVPIDQLPYLIGKGPIK